MEGHNDSVKAVAVSPDGSFVYSGSRDENAEQGSVKQWEAASGSVRAVACRWLAAGGCDDRDCSWSRRWKDTLAQCTVLLCRPTGRFLYLCANDAPTGRHALKQLDTSSGSVRFVWLCRRLAGSPELSALQLVRTLATEGHSAAIYVVAVSPDGRFIGSGGRDEAVKLWDTASGTVRAEYVRRSARGDAAPQLMRTIENPGPVHALVVSPDGRFIHTDSKDGCVMRWDALSGKVRAEEQRTAGRRGDMAARSCYRRWRGTSARSTRWPCRRMAASCIPEAPIRPLSVGACRMRLNHRCACCSALGPVPVSLTVHDCVPRLPQNEHGGVASKKAVRACPSDRHSASQSPRGGRCVWSTAPLTLSCCDADITGLQADENTVRLLRRHGAVYLGRGKGCCVLL
jgi:hypothetical protein